MVALPATFVAVTVKGALVWPAGIVTIDGTVAVAALELESDTCKSLARGAAIDAVITPVPPGDTDSPLGDSDTAMEGDVTVVVTVATLSVKSGSAVVPMAVASLTKGPGELGVTTIVTVALCPLSSGPASHSTNGVVTHSPPVLVAETMAYEGHVDWRFSPSPER